MMGLGLGLLVVIGVSCQSTNKSVEELEIRMAELVNVEREARGLAPLAFSPALSDVGREYSAKMAEARRVHHDLDRPLEERVRAALPDICTFGENLSKHTTIDYSLGDLMMSPGPQRALHPDRDWHRPQRRRLPLYHPGVRPPLRPSPKGSKRRKDLPE